jgi:hypothetical protein
VQQIDGEESIFSIVSAAGQSQNYLFAGVAIQLTGAPHFLNALGQAPPSNFYFAHH